jgi:hypothetical protein
VESLIAQGALVWSRQILSLIAGMYLAADGQRHHTDGGHSFGFCFLQLLLLGNQSQLLPRRLLLLLEFGLRRV